MPRRRKARSSVNLLHPPILFYRDSAEMEFIKRKALGSRNMIKIYQCLYLFPFLYFIFLFIFFLPFCFSFFLSFFYYFDFFLLILIFSFFLYSVFLFWWYLDLFPLQLTMQFIWLHKWEHPFNDFFPHCAPPHILFTSAHGSYLSFLYWPGIARVYPFRNHTCSLDRQIYYIYCRLYGHRIIIYLQTKQRTSIFLRILILMRHYWECNFPMTPPVRLLVGWLIGRSVIIT